MNRVPPSCSHALVAAFVVSVAIALGSANDTVQTSAAPNGSSAAQAPAQTQQAPSQAARRNPIPDTFTNLKVLPPTIAKPELVAVMKGFAKTMSVRCSHCHVATDDLSQADFAADDKPTKAEARELLKAIMQVKAATPAVAK